jgi:hypothetical protein
MAHPAADAAARASGIGREEEFRRPKPMLAGPPSATWTDVEATMLRNKIRGCSSGFPQNSSGRSGEEGLIMSQDLMTGIGTTGGCAKIIKDGISNADRASIPGS